MFVFPQFHALKIHVISHNEIEYKLNHCCNSRVIRLQWMAANFRNQQSAIVENCMVLPLSPKIPQSKYIQTTHLQNRLSCQIYFSFAGLRYYIHERTTMLQDLQRKIGSVGRTCPKRNRITTTSHAIQTRQKLRQLQQMY